MNLERKSGISIIEVHPSKIDAGRILKQTEVDISSDATYLSLMDDLGALGGRELVDTLRNYAEYKVITPVKTHTIRVGVSLC